MILMDDDKRGKKRTLRVWNEHNRWWYGVIRKPYQQMYSVRAGTNKKQTIHRTAELFETRTEWNKDTEWKRCMEIQERNKISCIKINVKYILRFHRALFVCCFFFSSQTETSQTEFISMTIFMLTVCVRSCLLSCTGAREYLSECHTDTRTHGRKILLIFALLQNSNWKTELPFV